MLRNIGSRHHQTIGNKRKTTKKYLSRTRKLLETKFCSGRNLLKRDKHQGSLVRYSGPFLKWTREDKKANDDVLHARDDIDRLYMSRKEGGRGLACIKNSDDASTKEFEDYIKSRKNNLITATKMARAT